MKKKILILGLSMLFVFGSCDKNKQFKEEEVNKECEASVLTKEDLRGLFRSDTLSNVQFVDIRNPHEFSMGHLPGAVNIPLKKLFEKELWKNIDKNKSVVVYGADGSSAQLAALLYHHFNNKKLSVALGGYAFIKDRILGNFNPDKGIYDDEIPVVSYKRTLKRIRNQAGIANSKPGTAQKKKTTKPVIKKRKKKEISAGCG
jgi:rhodanese-related sulfurtransferase